MAPQDDPFHLIGDHVGMWRWNIATGAIRWSRRMYELVGLSPGDLELNIDVVESLVHPEDRSIARSTFEAHIEDGRTYRFAYRLRHADGHYVYCRSEGAATRDADGQIHEMSGVAVDVSETMVAKQKLADSEARLASLAAHFEGAIFRYRVCADGSEAIDYMSDGAEQVWGMTAAEIAGNPAIAWSTVHPDDLDGVRAALAEGVENQARLNHRWRLVLPDGQRRWVNCRATPARQPNGDTVFDGFVIDISDMIAARDELRAKTEMLGQAQKLEAIGQIAGGIAHDFNNLLAIILGNAELIQEVDYADCDAESLEAIISACHKGADLTRRLLSFARQSQLDPKRVKLTSIIDGMFPLLRRTMPETIHIEWDTTGAPQCLVSVDVGLLESSILNIMLNARDAMPEGGQIHLRVLDVPDAEVALGGAPMPTCGTGFVKLEFRDTGVGIAAEVLPRVTEPFFTSKGPEMGSGLGLAMVDGFADQSGGSLHIESQPGQGTTVHLVIPCTTRLDVDSTLGKGADPDTQPLNGCALLVEDEQEVRLVTARHLRKIGIQVDAAMNGAQALELLDAAPDRFDLLISDVVMPGQPGGLELARLFQERHPGKPVILISGYSYDPAELADAQNPLLIRLTKPVDGATLAASVAELLMRAQDAR